MAKGKFRRLQAKNPSPTTPKLTPKKNFVPDTTTFPFLKLPRELRDEIYSYALTSDSDIHITKNTILQPALLRTCTQIRLEASPYYYWLSGNRFVFTTRRRYDMHGFFTFYMQYITAVGMDTPISEEFEKYGAVENKWEEEDLKGWRRLVERFGKYHPGEVEWEREEVAVCFTGAF